MSAGSGIVGLGPGSPVNPGRSQRLFRADVVRKQIIAAVFLMVIGLFCCSEAVLYANQPLALLVSRLILFILHGSMRTLAFQSLSPCYARDLSPFRILVTPQKIMTGSR